LCVPRGFSLVEVLIATAVLAATALGLAQLLVMSVRVNHASRVTTLAAILARQKIEQLGSMSAGELTVSPPGSLATDTAGWFELLDQSGRVLETERGAMFVRRWSIVPIRVPGTVVLQVAVVPLPVARSRSRQPGESRVVAIRRLLPA